MSRLLKLGVMLLVGWVALLTNEAQARCSTSAQTNQEIWQQFYAPYLGPSPDLVSWGSYEQVECPRLLHPERTKLKELKTFYAKEAFGDLYVFSDYYAAYLDPVAFQEIAFLLQRAAALGKSLTWYLHSDGGWWDVTLAILELLHRLPGNTLLVLPENAICYSSCLLLSAGFPNTWAHPDATFGLHAASRGDELSAEGTEAYLEQLKKYGVDSALLERLKKEGVFSTLDFRVLQARALAETGLFKKLIVDPET